MMNNEDFERKMTFIVNQQTQFAVDIDKLRQRQDKTEESIDRLVAVHTKTEEVVTRLAYVTNEGFKEVNAKINALVNSQIALEDAHRETEKQLKQTSEKVDKVSEAVDKVSETVDKLSDTVDRYIRRGRNGSD